MTNQQFDIILIGLALLTCLCAAVALLWIQWDCRETNKMTQLGKRRLH